MPKTVKSTETPYRSDLASPDGPGSQWPRVGLAICIGLAVVHLIATRLVWGQIPLQTDTGIWAYFAVRMLDGARLYGELWESKPPGIFWTFAAVERVFGGDRALLWLDAAVTVAVCLVTFSVARRFASRGAAVVAVCLLSVVMCHRVLADWGNNLEKFVALFEMTALWLIIRSISIHARDTRDVPMRNPRRAIRELPDKPEAHRSVPWVLVGLCCGIAAIYKQTGVLLLVLLMIGLVVRWRPIGAPHRAGAIVRLLIGAAIPWGVVLVWLLRNEVFADFWRQVVIHDLHRVSSAELERSRLLEYDHWANVGRHLLLAGVVMFPAAIGAVAAGCTRGIGDRSGTPSRAPGSSGEPSETAKPPVAAVPSTAVPIMTVYAVMATLIFVLAPHGYGHYLLQAAPPATILAAAALDRAWPPKRRPIVAVVVFLAMLAGLWQLGDHLHFTLDSRYPSRQSYARIGDHTHQLVRVIKAHTTPDQAVMLWPSNHTVNYYARRRTPLEICQAIDIFHGRIRLLDPPLDEVIRRIQSDPPYLIVDWTPVETEPEHPADPKSPLVLLVPAGGYSLAESPNPDHAHLEGRLLAPFKSWLQAAYGGQIRYKQLCTVYVREKPWRDWRDYLRDDQVRTLD